ncbi:MAG: S1C family serine protease, partial [Clostridia bacterium]|nr:S1C family serine protease [Clostridia bacterium]
AFGYAIPVNLACALAQNVIDNYTSASGKARIAKLGVSLKTEDDKGVYDEATGKYFIEEKVILDTVEVTGAAYKAGLQRGDTLVSATLRSPSNGTKTVNLTREYMLGNLLMEVRLGDSITFRVSRDGQAKDVTVAFSSGSNFSTIA